MQLGSAQDPMAFFSIMSKSSSVISSLISASMTIQMGMAAEDNEIEEENRLLNQNLGWCGVNANVIMAAAEMRMVANFIVCCFAELLNILSITLFLLYIVQKQHNICDVVLLVQ